MRIIAIDPGSSGAIVLREGVMNTAVFKMPEIETEIFKLLKELFVDGTIVVIENVGTYMPGNSAVAAVKFSRHIGFLHGALMAIGYRFDPPLGVRPKDWQNSIDGKPARPVTKGLDDKTKKRLLADHKHQLKNSIKEFVQLAYPNQKITLWNADAFGILYWYVKSRLK